MRALPKMPSLPFTQTSISFDEGTTKKITAQACAIAAGVPDTVPATTINQLCGSGLRAVGMAAQAIRAGDSEVVVAGGMESMSRAPHVAEVREGVKLGDVALRDTLIADGLWCALTDQHMGGTAEVVAERFGVSREDQDAFAAESQKLNEFADAKRRRKKVRLMVANLAQHAIGADENEVTLLDDAGLHKLPRAPKGVVARQIVAHIAALVTARKKIRK